LLASVGQRVPIQPAKGYSVTFDVRDREVPLRFPVIDDQLHAAVVPLGAAIRVAGTAEFAGYDHTVRPDRIRNLLALLRAVLPRQQFDVGEGKRWCGLRPMSVDGVPIIGATGLRNLYVNAGHGPLGWTMAAGSAELLADVISGSATGIDPSPFSLARFSR
jgi:D-amino-acid dehydrogenase